MFRFYDSALFPGKQSCLISIHPMFRFYIIPIKNGVKAKEFQYILCFGFTVTTTRIIGGKIRFQYILCFGFTIWGFIPIIHFKKFQYILCFGFTCSCLNSIQMERFISIHPMFRFYINLDGHEILFFTFQYILCFGFTEKYKIYGIMIDEFQYILCFGFTDDPEYLKEYLK